MSRLFVSLLGATLSMITAASALPAVQAQKISLDSPDQLKLLNVKVETVIFKGRRALRVADAGCRQSGLK